MDHETIITITTFALPLIFAITLHEAAHAFAANRLGDPTARLAGRLSVDPIRHIDPVGTILLPGLMVLAHAPAFGYAKPVPVNFDRLKPRRRGMILVALAGPVTNLCLAYISALLLHIEALVTPEQAPWTFRNIYNSVTVNVLLAAFNMLPFLPLDGGRVLNALLPPALARRHARTERAGMFLILALMLLPGLLPNTPIGDLPQYLIAMPAGALRDVVLHAAGIGNR